MEFDEGLIYDEFLAVNCKNEFEARELLDWANEQGITWRNGKSFLGPTRWHMFTEQTSYCLSRGVIQTKRLMEANDIRVISFDEASLYVPLTMEKI